MSKPGLIPMLVAVLATLAGCGGADQPLSVADLDTWLGAYGAAWEARDGDAAAALFTADASYRETPYDDPFVGRDAIRDYWNEVTSDQTDIDFESGIIAISDQTGIARWSARFRSISGDVPVELNGIFVLEFANATEVSALREWWHVR